MDDRIFTLSSSPRAILYVDGDAFFTSMRIISFIEDEEIIRKSFMGCQRFL
jgi:hypothetical protein